MATNSKGHVLIGKDISRTGSLVIGGSGDNLAEGEIVVLDKNMNVMTAGATYSDTDKIYILEGLGDTYDYVNEAGTSVTGVRKYKLSSPIDGAGVSEWSGVSYTAPTQGVWSIDFTGFAPVVDTEYVIRVVYNDLTPEDPGQYTQEWRYIAETTTLDTEIAAFAALIQADSRRRVNAAYTAGTDVLTLTGRPITDDDSVNSEDEYKQVNFEVFLTSDNFDTYTSSALTTEPNPGSGYWKQVRDAERYSQGWDGITNRILFPTRKPDMRVVKDETYDVLTIRSKSWYDAADSRREQTDITTKIFIPNPAAANQMTDVLAVLNPWMASLPGAFSTVSV